MVAVIDETDSDIIRLIASDFGRMAANEKTAFLDWLHYRARRIPSRPRRLVISEEIKSKRTRYPAIERISAALRLGEDVSPWLSRKLLMQKHKPTADMMFNAWQITHFHLGLIFVRPALVAGKNDLLFAHVNANEATLLDIQPHGSWTKQSLLGILLETNPKVMEQWEVRGILPGRSPLSDIDAKTLRAKHINGPFSYGSRVFNPGLGIMSSGHAVRLRLFADHLMHTIRDITKAIQSNSLPRDLLSIIAGKIGIPVRLGLAYDSDGTFTIFDKERGLKLFRSPPIE